MIGKELKILRLPALISLIVGVMFVVATTSKLISSAPMLAPTWTYVAPWPEVELTVWFFGYSLAVASAFACFQFAAELSIGSTWTFFAHRPVGMGRQFGVKLLVGLVVHSAVVGAVMGMFRASALIPGHILGPFPKIGWRLGLRDAALGMLFWFGVALTMIRSDRWSLARILPLFFCLGACVAAHFKESLPGYLTIALVAYAVLVLAAWGAAIGMGDILRMPSIAKLAHGAVILGASAFILNATQTIVQNNRSDAVVRQAGLADLFWHPYYEGTYPASLASLSSSWIGDTGRQALLCIQKPGGLGVLDVSSSFVKNSVGTGIPTYDWTEVLKNYHANHNEIRPGTTFYVEVMVFRGSSGIYEFKADSKGKPYDFRITRYKHRQRTRDNRICLSYAVDGLFLSQSGMQTRQVVSSLRTALWPTLLSIPVTLLLAYRLRWKRAVAIRWALACVPLGIYAPLLIIVLSPWTALAPCPKCGKKRIVSRSACEHCGAGWDKPALVGLEIPRA
jgi:hypothetical protein